MNATDFLYNFKLSQGFARPNQFSIEIFPPEGLMIDNTTLKSICNNCKSTGYPGKSLETTIFSGGGFIPRMSPFSMTYQWSALTFLLSADHKEKDFFEKWTKLAFNETTSTLGYYDDYVGTVIINQLKNHKMSKAYQLLEAFPLSVEPVQANTEQTNSISEISVNFAFRKYITNE